MNEMKGTYVQTEEGVRYFDRNGAELKDGDTIVRPDGRREKLYLTEDGLLGTDATNPKWVENGRCAPCEFGIYPLTRDDLAEIEKCVG